MKKSELVKIVSKEAGITLNEADNAVEAVFEAIKNAILANDSYSIERFITIKPVIRAARTGRNPATGESMDFPERKSVKIAVSQAFKKELNA